MSSMTENLKIQWPLAPYAKLVEADVENPSCVIRLRDGSKISGRLEAFNPDQGILQVSIDGATGPSSMIALDTLKQIELDQPIKLVSSTTLMSETDGIFSPPVIKEISVRYTDGETLKGGTFGFLSSNTGIYLYLVNADSAYVRSFIPADMVDSYSLGTPIGELLVEENFASSEEVDAGLQKQQVMRDRRIGDYFTGDAIIAPDQLSEVVRNLRNVPAKRLGEALIEAGLANSEQLDQALAEQAKNRKRPLGDIMVGMGIVDQATINRLMARKLGIPYVNLSRFDIDPNALKLVPEKVATKYNVMPIALLDQQLFLAMENPLLIEPLNEVRFYAKRSVEPVMADAKEISNAIRNYYGNSSFGDLASELSEALDPNEMLQEESELSESDNTLTRLVNKIILDAHHQGASDIHIETYPGRQKSIIRFRKDGMMLSYFNLPYNYRNAMVSRIKIMASLDISEKRRAQDGKIDFSKFGPAQIELRVASIPTNNGLEDVVLRLLNSGKPIPLAQAGLHQEVLEQIMAISKRPHGMFLVCGPTGSGKTTTLHSVLDHINTPERKIWTAEDPIEITQNGLRQVQINPKIGWTFATALRAFLRADPDVIMVGEMRDRETAQIAIEASLTGHLVLSTLHTNSAPESVVRLLDLGLDPFNFADALQGVLGQRLARRLCNDCKQARTASEEELDALISEYCLVYEQAKCPAPARATLLKEWRTQYANKKGQFTLYTPTGCPKCDNKGYKGRIALHELLNVDHTLKHLIQMHAPLEEMLSAALLAGMRTLKQDGIEKVLAGHTDMERVREVCT
jgi:type II secretory ATPase GspE/PulE/Tfp pilus assembly ATPase PilB-like protein